jgi:D-mannonate dehydratase
MNGTTSDGVQLNAAKPQEKERAAAQAFGNFINETLAKIAGSAHNQLVSTTGLAAIAACLPGTADLDPRELGAVIAAMSRGRADENAFREQVATFAAKIVTVAREARVAMAKAEAAGKATSPAR